MTQEQLNKFKLKITEFVDKHKDELTLIREDLKKVLYEVNSVLASNEESEETEQ